MTITIGVFADAPFCATGMSVVNHNLVYHLSRLYDDESRVIYFARFGQKEKGCAEYSTAYEGYELVNCESGVWKSETVKEAIKRYGVQVVYTEDDWWSMDGLIEATQQLKIPFYAMTPIDSLPIDRKGKEILEKYCNVVFVPNKSYREFRNGIYLPHAVDWSTFKPCGPKAFDKFTFLWIGRAERRKALERTILAYEKIYKDYPCNLVVRSNWDNPNTFKITSYIQNRNLPILKDMMTNCPHSFLAQIYSSCNAYICSSKAGAFEMGVLEAAACGLPSLTTDWLFMNENVIDDETGFLVPIDGYDYPKDRIKDGYKYGGIWGNISIEKLAEKMTYFVQNPDDVVEMGISGIKYARQRKWEDVATKLYETILEDLIKRKLYKKELS